MCTKCAQRWRTAQLQLVAQDLRRVTAHTGYPGSFAPPPNLSDEAVRTRQRNGSHGAQPASGPEAWDAGQLSGPTTVGTTGGTSTSMLDPNEVAPPQAEREGSPVFGPLVPDLNANSGSRATVAAQQPIWDPADRRQLGSFDARYYSTKACAPSKAALILLPGSWHIAVRAVRARIASH